MNNVNECTNRTNSVLMCFSSILVCLSIKDRP